VQTDASLAFLRRNSSEPFFLYLAYYAPHVPLEAPEKYLQRFPNQMPERRRTALAMMSAVDDGVGRIVELLKEQGVFERTLIIFTNDNGAPMADILSVNKSGPAWDGSRNDPLTGEKGMLSEGGIRVPMIWAWPDNLAKNTDEIENHPEITNQLRLKLQNWASELEPAGLPSKPLNGQEREWYRYYFPAEPVPEVSARTPAPR
jgi:arylsulfatase A-like enzyme